MSLKDTLQSLSTEVTDFLSASVVHRTEGIAIESVSSSEGGNGSLDVAAGDAYLAEMLRQHLSAQENLGRASTTEDLLIRTQSGILLARPLPDSDFVWTVITGPSANTTLTRALMRKFHVKIAEALPNDGAASDDDKKKDTQKKSDSKTKKKPTLSTKKKKS